MNRFKIFILSGVITALCSHFAWAGTINSISVDQENRIVVVSVQLSESSIDESLTKTSFTDDVFDIDIWAVDDTSTPSDYEVLVSFVIPECSEYRQIGVVLYAPDGYAQMPADAVMSIGANCDIGVNSCQGDYDTCVSCQVDCSTNFMTFLSDCSAAGCKTETQCQADLDACNVLWDESVVEELAAMTVQPVFPEVAKLARNIVVDVDCKPNRLNLNSKGKWVTCSIEPAEGIDVGSIILEEYPDLAVKKSKIEDEKLMVKFSRQELIKGINSADVPGPLELTITDGTFSGTDTIQVVNPGKKNKIQKTKRVKKAKKVHLAKKK